MSGHLASVLRRHDEMMSFLQDRQVGVSSSNPFSSGGFPGSGGNGDGGNSGSGGTNTGTGSGSGDGSGSGSGSGSSGDGSGSSGSDGSGGTSGGDTSGSGSDSGSGSSSGSSSDTYGGYGSGNGNGSGYPGSNSSGLSSNAIAGVAVGSVLAFFLLAALLVWLCTRHRRRQQLLRKHDQEVLAKDMRTRERERQGDNVAFAKVASANGNGNGSRLELPDLPALPDDPPAYEESQRQENVHGAHNMGHPLSGHQNNAADVEYAMGSVSDGFRQYSPAQPVHDAGGKANFNTPERRPDAGQHF